MTDADSKTTTEDQEGRKLVTVFEGTGAATLKEVGREVKLPLSDDDRTLVNDLLQYVIQNEGLGMAAIQLGEAKRIFVFEKPAGARRLQVVIDPVVHSMTGVRRRPERCFSVPLDSGVLVERPKTIVVSYYDEDGNFVEKETLNSATAQIFLHEFSHLEGLTILDNSPYGKNLGLTRL